MTRTLPAVALLALLPLTAPAAAQSDQVNIRKVAFTGDPAPGGGTFDRLRYRLRTNNLGEVAFSARVEVDGELIDGLFLWDGITVHSLIREGDVLPDGPVSQLFYDRIALNWNGEVAISIRVQEPAGETHRLVVATIDGIRTIVKSGDPAPDGNGFLTSGSWPRINDRGEVLFRTTVFTEDGSSADAYFVAYPNGELVEVARQFACDGDPANGDEIAEFGHNAQDQNLNWRGSVSFPAELCNGDIAAFLWTPEIGLRPVLRDGDPSPVTGEPLEITSSVMGWNPGGYLPTVLDDHDRVLVVAWPPGGYYLASDEGIEAVWALGDPLDDPVDPLAVTIDHTINNRGTLLAFVVFSPIEIVTSWQLHRFVNRSGQRVFENEQPVPDWPGQHFRTSTESGYNNINDVGQIAFTAEIQNRLMGSGLFMTDCHGAIHTIAGQTLTITVEGQEYFVSVPINGKFLNIPLYDTSPSDGQRALNDRGEFAFWAGISEGDPSEWFGAILIASIDGCPCPGDTDIDGTVGVFDLLNVLFEWGPCEGFCEGDLNFDHHVDVLDLLDVLGGWGPCE